MLANPQAARIVSPTTMPLKEAAMKLIDLSREIYHKMPRLPNHPMIIISAFTTHEEKRVADGYSFSSAVTSLNMSDHSVTHVDVHRVWRDLGFAHVEGLIDMEQRGSKVRFRFTGFPLKIKGGRRRPIRAVAWLDA